MREELLHFIWEFRYFNQRELTTETGEPLIIQYPGESNSNQGPDFLHARIFIGDRLSEGSVELHVRASDWQRHGHEGDPHFDDVILHVVWENDSPEAPSGIPILSLMDRTPKALLSRYRDWMDDRRFVPCEPLLVNAIPSFSLRSWCHRLLLQRLERRTRFIARCIASNRDDWELTTWWLMARSMGQPVNTELFFEVARTIPLTCLLRLRGEPAVLEALLLGQAGLLDRKGGTVAPQTRPGDTETGLPTSLPPGDRRKKDYQFYRAKYDLRPVGLPASFHRMRPAHFPDVRLVQLAGLLAARCGWFTMLRESAGARQVEEAMQCPDLKMGAVIRKSVLVNAFVPVLFAYGMLRRDPAACAKSLAWLYETAPERNALLSGWRRLGITAGNAAESQALLELRKNYCVLKKCLDCDIGRHLLTTG